MEEEIVEEWRNVVGYEGLYQISNLGRIKSLRDNHNNPREKIMKQIFDKDGYLKTILSKNKKHKCFMIHRLVAIAFIPNPDNLPQINHKDENKTNNSVENLEWCDHKYNVNYGTCQERKVKNTDYKKRTENTDYKKKIANTDYKTIAEKKSKPVIQFDLEGKTVAEYPSIKEAERQTEFKHSNIIKSLKGNTKTCGGYIWKYKNEGED